jgi:hypothetical protein
VRVRDSQDPALGLAPEVLRQEQCLLLYQRLKPLLPGIATNQMSLNVPDKVFPMPSMKYFVSSLFKYSHSTTQLLEAYIFALKSRPLNPFANSIT